MNKFESLGVNPKIVKAIAELGFENPTPIQEQAIPMLMGGGNDLVGLAQTGTGKTAAFGLPLLHLIDFSLRKPQALILCPTRELCIQITRDLQNFSKYIDNANVVAIYGGASIENQIKDIQRGAQIIVATPGRMVDMLERKRVDITEVDYAVLDEADEMLNMGFQEDLTTILSKTPDTKKTWLFSATMPNEVARIAKKYMHSPLEITVGGKNSGNANIEHVYYVVHARDKYLALKRIADYNPDIFGIVFCRTKRETQEVADNLIKDGYNADALHGDLSQAQRDYVMKRYRNKTLQMLVATDVAARGIDVNNVTHVINYNLPDEIENYTHRSGRTARAGKSGVSICIINMKEVGKIREIERIIGGKFNREKVPTGAEASEKQLLHIVKKMHNVKVNESEIQSFLPAVYDEFKDVSREDLIKKLVSVEFNRFLEYYRNAPDLNVDGQKQPSRSQRLFMNLGQLDKLDRTSLKEYISLIANLPLSAIHSVELKNSFSFVEVEPKAVETIMNAFKNERYNNRNVEIELSERRDDDRGGRSSGGRKSFGRGNYGGGNKEGGYGRSGRGEGFKEGGYGRSGRSEGGYGKSSSDRKGGSGYPKSDRGGSGDRPFKPRSYKK